MAVAVGAFRHGETRLGTTRFGAVSNGGSTIGFQCFHIGSACLKAHLRARVRGTARARAIWAKA
eukprot:5871705-Lingulodinium_polyedra.AAC.1